MPEWPVRVVEYGQMMGRPRGTQEEVLAAPYRTRNGQGEAVFDGMSVSCPRCGSIGSCPMEGKSWTGSGWIFEPAVPEPGDVLTMNPSIVCDCGGHYWLHDGALKEV